MSSATSQSESGGVNVFVPRIKFKVPDRIVWLIAAVCAMPVLLNIIGIDFGYIGDKLDPYKITQLYQ
ncbi:MAG TPA: hypothetical protein PKL85_09680, partial [Bacteroidia bacterium]|nr:hypothetical protein [Bacteroidia bacterium]